MTNQPPEQVSFRLIEHSGDLKIEAIGKDYLEALASASSGLVGLVLGGGDIQEREQYPVTVTGDDETTRTIGFLNELIYLIYARHWLPKRVKWLKFCSSAGCKTLEGILVGEPLDASRHQLRLDLKAVTYHEFELVKSVEGCSIRFVCDL